MTRAPSGTPATGSRPSMRPATRLLGCGPPSTAPWGQSGHLTPSRGPVHGGDPNKTAIQDLSPSRSASLRPTAMPWSIDDHRHGPNPPDRAQTMAWVMSRAAIPPDWSRGWQVVEDEAPSPSDRAVTVLPSHSFESLCSIWLRSTELGWRSTCCWYHRQE